VLDILSSEGENSALDEKVLLEEVVAKAAQYEYVGDSKRDEVSIRRRFEAE